MGVREELGAAAQLDSTPEANVQQAPEGGAVSRRGGRRGGKAALLDTRGRLERSLQSARECRARKKLRYQYLEDLVKNRENAVFALRKELDQLKQWSSDVDHGEMPMGLIQLVEEEQRKQLANK